MGASLHADMVHIRCYMEKAKPARHRPERQHNACANRRKQCSTNETKSYSNPTPPRKRSTYGVIAAQVCFTAATPNVRI